MFDFKKRQDLLQEKIKDKSFITLKSENIFYLTGFKGSFGMYLQTPNQRVLISDSRYKQQGEALAKEAKIGFVIYDKDFQKNFGEKQTGETLVEKSLTLSEFEQLENKFPNIKLLPNPSPVNKLRNIKDSKELKLISNAQAHVDEVLFPFLKNHLKEGVSEQEITYLLKKVLEEKGHYGLSFEPIMAFGENSANPHYTPGERKLKKGDNILIDCGVIYQGYCSDMTRNAFFGTPTKKYIDAYNLLQESLDVSLKLSTAGASISEIDKACRDTLGNENQYFTHSLGHGVGLEVHEAPTINRTSNEALETNQVITLEPGLYYEGQFGIRIEDLLVITDKKPLVLSKSSKELLVI